MPKKRRCYSQLRDNRIKLTNGVDVTETPKPNDWNPLKKSKSSGGDPSGSKNGLNSFGKSHTSSDVQIIDGQTTESEDPPATTDSDSLNDENMNDNNVEYAIKVEQKTHKLFDRIRYSEEAVSTLPNRSWAIHCIELPVKRIVVSEMIMHDVNGTGLEPFYIKQIVFDEKLSFEIFILNSKTVLKDKPSSIHSMEDFETLLDHVQGLKLCSGGPDYQQYSHITPECAYKDPTNKWRHNLCTLEVNDCETCESCLSLDDILKRHAQRVKPSVKHKNVISMRRKRLVQPKDT